MNRERRTELIRQARYFAAGLVENSEPMLAGGFEVIREVACLGKVKELNKC